MRFIPRTRAATQVFCAALVAVALLAGANPARSQVNCSGVNLNLAEVNVPDFQTVFLSNFNIISLSGSIPLFELQILESQPGGTNVRMIFEVIAQQYAAGGPIIRAETNPFQVIGSRTFNSNDFAGQGDISGDVDFNTDAAQDLQNAILSTGRLPSDIYILRVRVENVANAADFCVWEKRYDISNPTTIDLISPGRVAGSGDCPVIYTTLPLFQWDSNATKFLIRISEKRPENASPEDVMNNESRVPERILVAGTDFLGRPSFQYPASGAGVFPLEEGKTYYWQVTAFVETPSGDVPLESQIWCFTVGQISGPTTSAEQIQLLDYLRALIGNSMVDQLFGDGGELFGYLTTGVILRDGSGIAITDLATLVSQVQSGQLSVTEVTVE